MAFDVIARLIVRHDVLSSMTFSDFVPDFDVYLVWSCKTLQNYKCLICTNLHDELYYELTYNGDKDEWYIDKYTKVSNVCMSMKDALKIM